MILKFSPISNLLILSLAIVSQATTGAAGCEKWIGTLEKRNEILELVEQTMRTAGKKVIEHRNSDEFKVSEKKNFSDLKTEGDCLSQRIILDALNKNQLTHEARFIAEEKCKETDNLVKASQKYTDAAWIIDPIDGTTNYASGLHHFAISVSLVSQGEICFGAVYAPKYDEFYYAHSGFGTFAKFGKKEPAKKITVSPATRLKDALWATGTEGGPEDAAKEKNKNTFVIAEQVLPKSRDLRRFGSAALDLAYVATGKLQGYFELSEGLKWWDIAAGVLLVQEAKGRVKTKPDYCSQQSHSLARFSQPIDYILATNQSEEIFNTFSTLLEDATRNPTKAK